jgi:hypothetical protein
VSEALAGAGSYEGVSPLRRIAPVRRRRNRGLLGLFAGALLRALLMVGVPGGVVVWLLYSPYFLIRDLQVEGGARVSAAWLEENLRPLAGRHILAVSLQGVRQRLSAHPWVASVELRRELPDRLRVTVAERQPVALRATAAGPVFLDGDGEAIAPAPPTGVAGLLLVHHSRPGPVPVGAALDVVGELQRAEPAWGLGAREVEVLGEGDFRVVTTALPFPLLLRAGRVGEGVANLRQVMPELSTRVAAVELVDLRQPRRLVVRPAAGAARRPAVAGEVAATAGVGGVAQ